MNKHRHTNAFVTIDREGPKALDHAIKDFNAQVKESGIIQEVRDRRSFIKPSLKRRLKKLKRSQQKEI